MTSRDWIELRGSVVERESSARRCGRCLPGLLLLVPVGGAAGCANVPREAGYAGVPSGASSSRSATELDAAPSFDSDAFDPGIDAPLQATYVQVYAPPPYAVFVGPGYGPLAAKPGFYFGAALTGTGMGGDLDGDGALFGPAVVLLPDVDPGIGFNVAVGFRGPEDAFELSYDYSDNPGSFQGMPLDSTFNAVNFDWKHFFRIYDRLQPYTLFGMNIPWLDIHDGAHRGSTVGDATLYGIGMNLGGGAAYYLTPQLSVSLQGVFRLIEYFEVSALGYSGSLDSAVFSPGWKFSLGTAFTF